MFKRKKTIIICIVSLLTFTAGISTYISLGENKNEQTVVTFDYEQLDNVVPKTLKTMPNIEEYITSIHERDMKTFKNILNDTPVKDLFDESKSLFRIKVESGLAKQKEPKNVKDLAKERVDNHLNALSIAENIYKVTISQEEITSYIDDHISNITSDEKELYANALGLTVEELDYIFDRDIYAMDTLWEKLLPVLMENQPQKEDEDNNEYLERIKMEFYRH